MFTRLSLRLRIFLFFCILAFGGAGLAAVALMFGWSRGGQTLPASPFVNAFVIFAFLNTGLAAAVWLLFDENVAKPIERLSASLRLRAHSGVDGMVNPDDARYLGDLAPAANALSQTVSTSLIDTAERVARETQRLRAESEQLTSLLSEIPIATILLNPAQEIVLYDTQAAEILSQIAAPRLKAPLGDYFDETDVWAAMARLSGSVSDVSFALHNTARDMRFSARLKPLGDDGHMVCIDVPVQNVRTIAPRPLTFDFDLMNATDTSHAIDLPLSQLTFVPFDTETTGLSVLDDDIVQLGAVRVLNGRIIDGEVMDTFVNPGRPIPPASTKVHRIADTDVADAPDIETVGRAFHHFARDAVLVAHNAPFDIGLLRKYEARMGVRWTNPVLDTVLLSAVVFGTNEEHALDALCDRLSIAIPPDQRHTALGDAKATAKALVKLLPLVEAKGMRTFSQLIDATRLHSRLLHDLNG